MLIHVLAQLFQTAAQRPLEVGELQAIGGRADQGSLFDAFWAGPVVGQRLLDGVGRDDFEQACENVADVGFDGISFSEHLLPRQKNA